MAVDVAEMREQCRRVRNDIIDAVYHARSGHLGGSLSCVEILWTLYTGHLRIRAEQPDWPDRDRLILSKGHAAPALYAVLAAKGFMPREELLTLRKAGSRLQGHPDMKRLPGVDISSGSLGMGISAGVGMALAGRLSGKDYKVYVLVGDGELQEGQNWEALMSAAKFALSNLVVIVDRNGVQLDGPVDQVMPVGNVADKLNAFGWRVADCAGHDCQALQAALIWAGNSPGQPSAIVARTIKGKGVSFMEGQAAWHGKPLSDEDYRRAKRDLGGQA